MHLQIQLLCFFVLQAQNISITYTKQFNVHQTSRMHLNYNTIASI